MSSKRVKAQLFARAALFVSAFGYGSIEPALSQPSTYEWTEIVPQFAVLRDTSYKTNSGAEIRFTAVRFHLGFYRLKLASTQETLAAGRDVKDGIARFTVNGEPRAELLSYSLEGTLSHLKEKPIALAPAGWATNQRNPRQIALLRINGHDVSPPTSRPSFSAVLCLNDTEYYKNYDATVPVIFTSNDISSLNPRSVKCKDAVQIGPRIIEEGGKRGITESELKTEKYQRVVFFVDEPYRDDALPARAREAARNGYILITHNKVHLFDLQTMLLDKPIYSGGAPHWAVNLAGDDHTGLLINTPPEPEQIENTLATVGSVLIVERR